MVSLQFDKMLQSSTSRFFGRNGWYSCQTNKWLFNLYDLHKIDKNIYTDKRTVNDKRIILINL